MPRDKSDKSSKSPKKGRYELRTRTRDERRRRKAIESSSSDSSVESESEEESDDGELDKAAYRKFLSKLFPSRFMNARIEEIQEEEEEESSSESDEPPRRRRRRKRHKRNVIEESDEETDDDDDDSFAEPRNNVNIVFSICEPDIGEEDETETEEEDDDEDTDEEEEDDSPEDNERGDAAYADIEEYLVNAKLPAASPSEEGKTGEVSDRDILAGLVTYMRGLSKTHNNKIIGELEKIGKDRMREMKKAEEKADRRRGRLTRG